MGTPSTSAVTFRAHIVPSAVLQHAAGNDNPLKCSLSRAECVFGEHRNTNKKRHLRLQMPFCSPKQRNVEPVARFPQSRGFH